MRLLLRWLLSCAALLITIHVVPGLSPAGGVLSLLGAALAIGLLNLLARPLVLLLKAITFPLACLTFGVWTLALSFFVNILVFYLLGSLGWGFRAEGFVAAALGALVMSVLNAALVWLFELGRRAPRG